MGKYQKLGSAKYQLIQHFQDNLDERGISREGHKRSFAKESKELGIANSPQNLAERTGITSHGTFHNTFEYSLEAFKYMRGQLGIKSIGEITGWMVGKYMDSKIEELKIKGGGMVNERTVNNIAGYMVKVFGVGLDRVEGNNPNDPARLADLKAVKAGTLSSMRVGNMQHIDHVRLACDSAKSDHAESFYRTEQARAYDDPRAIAAVLKSADHQTACHVIRELGLRASEVSLIRPEQLSEDNKLSYIGKGNQKFARPISAELADKLRESFNKHGAFKVDQRAWREDLKQASEKTGQEYNAIHGLRWNFAQERYDGYIAAGMEHKDALLATSKDLGHHRPEITEHYLQRK